MAASAHCGVLPPPKGVTANCDDPETQRANNIALHTIMLIAAAASLGIRLHTRFFILRRIGLDDYLAVIGFGLLITYSTMLLVLGEFYLGHHIWDIRKGDYIYGHKLDVITQWIYCVLSPILKLTALWFYRRIFGPQTRTRYVVHGVIVFIIIAYTALLFISVLSCMPLERRFNQFIEGHCLPQGVTAYLSGAINVLTDAFVVLLPMPAIWKLNLQAERKLRAFCVFGLGIIVLILSIVRLALTPMVFKDIDGTWQLSKFAIYSILEMYFGFMCVCFIASPAFLDKYIPGFMSSIKSTAVASLRFPSYLQSRHDTPNETAEHKGPSTESYKVPPSTSSTAGEKSWRDGSNTSTKTMV